MKGKLISIFAETQMHVGIGRSETFVDLPFAREGITEYPFIPGTGIKGSLRHKFVLEDKDTFEDTFGNGKAGKLVFSDGRLLLLPVRSLSKSYFWITCPYIIERLNRDLKVLGYEKELPIPDVKHNTYLGKSYGSIVLEDREFTHGGSTSFDNIVQFIGKFLPHESTRKRLKDQLLILNDDDFKWYAKYGLMIQARNVLNENKTSQNLWYEEWVPTDTLFYSIILNRTDGTDPLLEKFVDGQYVQIGGNETVGQGITLFKEVSV